MEENNKIEEKKERSKINSSNLGMCFKLAHKEYVEEIKKCTHNFPYDNKLMQIRTKQLYVIYNKIKDELEREEYG